MGKGKLPGPAAAAASCPLVQIARLLVPLEPADPDDDIEAEHFRRQDILNRSAAFLPVKSPEGAALALSAAAEGIMDVLAHEFSREEQKKIMQFAVRAVANTARWLRQEAGAAPLRTPFPSWADPFEDEPDFSYINR